MIMMLKFYNLKEQLPNVFSLFIWHKWQTILLWQKLPLETLSALKDNEVYRMPSVSSMFVLFDKCNNKKKQVESNLAPFPSIDHLCDTFSF